MDRLTAGHWAPRARQLVRSWPRSRLRRLVCTLLANTTYRSWSSSRAPPCLLEFAGPGRQGGATLRLVYPWSPSNLRLLSTPMRVTERHGVLLATAPHRSRPADRLTLSLDAASLARLSAHSTHTTSKARHAFGRDAPRLAGTLRSAPPSPAASHVRCCRPIPAPLRRLLRGAALREPSMRATWMVQISF